MAEPVVSSSLVPGAPLRGVLDWRAVRAPGALRFVGGARGLTLSLSLLVHASFALFAAHRLHAAPQASAEVAALSPIDVADAEVLPEPLAPSAPLEIKAPQPATPLAAIARAVAHAPVAAAPPAADVVSAPVSEAVASAAPAPAPRFAMTVAATSALVVAPTSNPGIAATPGPEAPINERAADVPARLLVGAPPGYTAAAQAAGIEADVPLEIVVDRAGAVQSARGLSHVGYGLDEAALAAVRSYRFSAAHRAGSAVAVRMHWMMRFQLR